MVYSVISPPETPEAVFFSAEEAREYTQRFKVNPTYKIAPLLVMPTYLSDKARSPYLIKFESDYQTYVSLMTPNDGEPVDKLLQLGYRITKDESLYVYVLATDEADALRQALPVRDKLIATGDWVFDEEIY